MKSLNLHRRKLHVSEQTSQLLGPASTTASFDIYSERISLLAEVVEHLVGGFETDVSNFMPRTFFAASSVILPDLNYHSHELAFAY